MHYGNIEIPDALIRAARSGRLVVFAGAGVSMQEPCKLPSFDELVSSIKEQVDYAGMLRTRDEREPPERYLGYLEEEGCDIKSSCASIISKPTEASQLHRNILRLFESSSKARIVTTNFDTCFERANDKDEIIPPIYTAPALPLGESFEGIVHLHGSVNDPRSLVLTARDYGKAYITKGWASSFLVDLFKSNTALFVGYSCNDSLVDYLTRSISAEIDGNAFALVRSTEDASEWRSRGIQAIPFDDYSQLPLCIGEWADDLSSSVTDRYKRTCEIADSPFELSAADEEFLKQSLTWDNPKDRAVFTRGFCAKSTSFGHLALLDSWNLMECLFKDTLEDSEYQIMRWAIRTFSVAQREKFQGFCSARFDKLSPRFFEEVAWYLASTDASPAVIGPWVAWLESVQASSYRKYNLSLLEIASKADDPEVAFAVLRILLRIKLSFSDRLYTGVLEPEAAVSASNDYEQGKLVELAKRYSKDVGGRLFDYCLQQIVVAYSILTYCWSRRNAFDRYSFSRSSIAPHEQDRFSNTALDALVDVIRECCPAVDVASKALECLESNCAIVVRIGLWLLESNDLVDNALTLLEERDYMRETELHHEAFLLAKKAYHLADKADRQRFAEYIRSIYEDTEDDYSDYRAFNICSWILGEKEDALLSELRDEILRKNPNFKVREHPELTHYISSGWVEEDGRWAVDEEAFTLDNMLDKMKSAKDSSDYPFRFEIVGTPAKQYPDKALDMLFSLTRMQRSEDESEIANLLISSISWGAIDWKQPRVIETIGACATDGQLLCGVVRMLHTVLLCNPETINAQRFTLKPILENIIAKAGAVFISDSSLLKSPTTDWAQSSANHPIGQTIELITRFFSLNDTDEWHNEIDPICKNLLNAVIPLIHGQSDSANCTIASLFSHLGFWYQLEPDLTSQVLIPMLSEKRWESAAAWHGLSYHRGIPLELWAATMDYWQHLFNGSFDLGKDVLESLTRLYVYAAITQQSSEECLQLIARCASFSAESCRTAYMQIDWWMDSQEDSILSGAWRGWLKQLIEYLASKHSFAGEIGMEFIARWIREYPQMRTMILELLCKNIFQDCSNRLFVHEGTYSSISNDANLSEEDKARILTFLIEHQDEFFYKQECIEAIRQLDVSLIEQATLDRLRDECTRQDILEAFSAS